jgi:hypothetical protein
LSALFHRGHINHESKFHIAAEYSFVGFVGLLDSNHLNIRLDLMQYAEVEHFLRFFDPAVSAFAQAA